MRMLEEGRHGVENQYVRAVHREGNPAALRLIRDVFEVTDRKWRGIGTIPQSGFRLSPAYAEFDAEQRFAVEDIQVAESSRLHQRTDSAGAQEAARLPGVRQTSARRRTRWGQRWSRRKVPAPLTTTMDASGILRLQRLSPTKLEISQCLKSSISIG